MQGAGNDFVVLDGLESPFPADFPFAQAAQTLCDRHFGIGADGLLTLENATNGAKARMRMWNPDGSEDMCGNGLRCVAALAARQKHIQKPDFLVQTLAGNREIEVLSPQIIKTSMGKPDFSPQNVPHLGKNPLIEGEIEIARQKIGAVTSVSTGSTHTVIFRDVSPQEFNFLSPQIEISPFFPDRTSIMWAATDGPNRFKIRIWERGVGETLACGTGACAVAVAAIETGRANGKIEIESRGGVLEIEWPQKQEIWKTGPAIHVFEGQI